MGLKQVEKVFLHFLPYLVIFQCFAAPSVSSTLKNHQIWQKFGEKITCKLASGRTGTQNPIFRIPGISRKMGLRQVEQGFSSFFAKFLPYLMIF